MKMDENLAAVHAYLCADGYVIKNPPTQKHNYYVVGLRNTNLELLRDFQDKFEKVFGIKPHLIEGQRCRIGSKEIYRKLTEEFGSFYSWEWRMPKLNDELVKIWLRAYFDCEGWVFCKSHQNRHIGADCVNKIGLEQIEKALNKLGIATTRKFNKKRNIHRLIIYGKENIMRFRDKIGFLHPKKAERLLSVTNDFMVYEWVFPKDNVKLREFIKNLITFRAKMRKNSWIVRIISNKEDNLINLQKGLTTFFKIESRINKMANGIGTVYYEMSINRREEVAKLINAHLLSKSEEEKWLKLKK